MKSFASKTAVAVHLRRAPPGPSPLGMMTDDSISDEPLLSREFLETNGSLPTVANDDNNDIYELDTWARPAANPSSKKPPGQFPALGLSTTMPKAPEQVPLPDSSPASKAPNSPAPNAPTPISPAPNKNKALPPTPPEEFSMTPSEMKLKMGQLEAEVDKLQKTVEELQPSEFKMTLKEAFGKIRKLEADREELVKTQHERIKKFTWEAVKMRAESRQRTLEINDMLPPTVLELMAQINQLAAKNRALEARVIELNAVMAKRVDELQAESWERFRRGPRSHRGDDEDGESLPLDYEPRIWETNDEGDGEGKDDNEDEVEKEDWEVALQERAKRFAAGRR